VLLLLLLLLLLLQVASVQLAESRLQGAVDVISLGKVVVTNRLHAAIMANLVGRPLIWIDTAQKKTSGKQPQQ
jgi:exopolysaccharide biosynthesis predicted pyruvyltransferase EpsI